MTTEQRTCDECGNTLTLKEVRRYNGWEFHPECKVRVVERVRQARREAYWDRCDRTGRG